MVPEVAGVDFWIGGARSGIGWAVALGIARVSATATGMQATNLPIRKYRMRILYLRNKKHQPFIKTNGLALDYVYPNTGSDPYKVKPKRNDGKEDSLLSWLLPSASLQELKHKVKEIAALHKKSQYP
jgi:hypothetical protein